MVEKTEQSVLPAGRAEWRRLVYDPFLPSSGHIVYGTESVVYRRPELPYVVKRFRNETPIAGYQIALDLLDGLFAQTALIDNKQIGVGKDKYVVRKGVVQERVVPLEERFIALVADRNKDGLVNLINQKAALDREIMQRGVYIQDPGLKNYGTRDSGKVVLIDPGRAVTNPSQDKFHLTRVINRGWTHYSIYMRLQDWGEHQLKDYLQDPHELSDTYSEEIGLTFDPEINASTHLLLGIEGGIEGIAAFMGKTMGNLAQEELEKYFPKKIPVHPDIDTFGTGHLDEWEEQSGHLVRKSS